MTTIVDKMIYLSHQLSQYVSYAVGPRCGDHQTEGSWPEEYTKRNATKHSMSSADWSSPSAHVYHLEHQVSRGLPALIIPSGGAKSVREKDPERSQDGNSSEYGSIRCGDLAAIEPGRPKILPRNCARTESCERDCA